MPKLGLDEQKPDTRPLALGNAAMDAEARYSFGSAGGKSGGARGKETRLNLGGLSLWSPRRPAGAATPGDGTGEVSRGHSSRSASVAAATLLADEGPNPWMQGAVGPISMSAKQQQGELYQRLLFEERAESPRHGEGSKGGTRPSPREEQQAFTATGPARALTERLMEEVTDRDNLNRAYRQVKANRGAPGVDGMTIAAAADWIVEHKEELIASLLDGSYRPQPVRGVEIPKPGGGMRQLGIPTVIDRLVQQAILQVLQPLVDPTFSDSSYGFRPGRSAHDALHQAAEDVKEGRALVVDMDLEKFFDRVNHDILMARLARRIADKRLLAIIRRFLEAGLMQEGVCVARHEGTPQGGPLAPPTKVQNSLFASIPGKKGEVNAIDDAELMGLDHHALDQRAEDLATRVPIGLVQVVRHGFRKAVQARQRLAQHGLFARLGLNRVELRLEIRKPLPCPLQSRFKLCAINHAIRVGINQTIHRSLRMADLFRQRLLTVRTPRCSQSSLVLLPQQRGLAQQFARIVPHGFVEFVGANLFIFANA